jgi:hypothetical protein
MPFTKTNGGIVVTGDSIPLYRLLTLKYALKLEIAGLKRRGRTAYAVIKSEFGWTGNRRAILERLTAHINRVALEQARENEANEARKNVETARKNVETGSSVVDGNADVAPSKKRSPKGGGDLPPAGGTQTRHRTDR